MPGDLIIVINVDGHPDFVRYHKDLICTRKISFRESVEGISFTIPHFAGPVNVNTAEFGILDPRKDYIIKDKGMKGGNLRISFDIQYPNGPLM
jgi:DnaJ-class molecular chaperone